MIMFSYKQTIAITNSTLYPDNYLQKIEEIALLQPWAIILREKNLSEKDYETLAKAVMAICEKQQTKLFLHSYINVAKKLNHTKIHLSLPALQQHQDEMDFFQEIGVSVHSLDQAIEAEKLGATYITPGHIFATDCKKGLRPRGLDFLAKIVKSVKIPVYGIGGICPKNAHEVLATGAKGVAMMSAFK
ncbi:MAG: thiamine phosphate synthase [Clostridiales bacterium]